MENEQTTPGDMKTVREKWLEQREDLTGEYKWGDVGQGILAVLFFGVWIIDSFFMNYTTFLNEVVPPLLRVIIGVPILCLAAYLAWAGLRTVFHEVREEPSVIRKGVFRFMRHPVYFSEVLLYLGLFILNMSLAAIVVWIGAIFFLYHLSRFEERLLLNRFGEDYAAYIRDVGMWIPKIGKK